MVPTLRATDEPTGLASRITVGLQGCAAARKAPSSSLASSTTTTSRSTPSLAASASKTWVIAKARLRMGTTTLRGAPTGPAARRRQSLSRVAIMAATLPHLTGAGAWQTVLKSMVTAVLTKKRIGCGYRSTTTG